jgi:hypothetical protein
MPEEWYYSSGGQQNGPVPLERLRELVYSGTLKARDLVWKQGMAQWSPLSSVPDLFPPAGGGSPSGPAYSGPPPPRQQPAPAPAPAPAPSPRFEAPPVQQRMPASNPAPAMAAPPRQQPAPAAPLPGPNLAPPSAPEPQATAPASQSLGGHAPVSRSSFQTARQRRFQPATSWMDLFDWKFEKYLTPWIVRATWLICVIGAFLWLAFISIGTLWSLAPDMSSSRSETQTSSSLDNQRSFEERPSSGPPGWLSARLVSAIAGLTGIGFVIVMLLWIRVVLETSIVLFNISATLSAMDQKADAQRAGP